MKAVPWIIGAIVALVVGIAALLLVPRLGLGTAVTGGGVDSRARIELERMRYQLDALEERAVDLENRVGRLN